MDNRKITWSKRASNQFSASIAYIRSKSDQNADNVKTKVLIKINSLSNDIHAHRIDPLKRNNDGNHRYFEIQKLRISYYEKPNEVIITRVRHTKQQPQQY